MSRVRRRALLPSLRGSRMEALLIVYAIALIVLPTDLGPKVAGFTLSLSRLVLIALVASVAIVALRERARLRAGSAPVVIAWTIFLASAAVSTLLSPSMPAIGRLGSLIGEGLVLFVVASQVLSRTGSSSRLVWAMAVAGGFVVVASFVAAISGHRYVELMHFDFQPDPIPASLVRFGLVRQQGAFPAPLFFGIFLSAILVSVFPQVVTRFRPFQSATAAVLLLGVISTQSRSAVVLSLALAGVIAAISRRWLVGGVLVTLAFASTIWLADLSSPAAPIPSETNVPRATLTAAATPVLPGVEDALAGSNELRIEALRGALIAWQERPLFGHGLLTAKAAVSAAIGSENYVDSTYLVMLVELGLLGVASFTAWLLVGIWETIDAFRRTRSALAFGIVAALFAVALLSVTASYFASTQAYALLALLLALGTVTGQSTDPSPAA